MEAKLIWYCSLKFCTLAYFYSSEVKKSSEMIVLPSLNLRCQFFLSDVIIEPN